MANYFYEVQKRLKEKLTFSNDNSKESEEEKEKIETTVLGKSNTVESKDPVRLSTLLNEIEDFNVSINHDKDSKKPINEEREPYFSRYNDNKSRRRDRSQNSIPSQKVAVKNRSRSNSHSGVSGDYSSYNLKSTREVSGDDYRPVRKQSISAKKSDLKRRDSEKHGSNKYTQPERHKSVNAPRKDYKDDNDSRKKINNHSSVYTVSQYSAQSNSVVDVNYDLSFGNSQRTTSNYNKSFNESVINDRSVNYDHNSSYYTERSQTATSNILPSNITSSMSYEDNTAKNQNGRNDEPMSPPHTPRTRDENISKSNSARNSSRSPRPPASNLPMGPPPPRTVRPRDEEAPITPPRTPRTPRMREDDPNGRAPPPPRTPRMREDDPNGRPPRTPRMREDEPNGRTPRTPRMREDEPNGRTPRTPRMREDDPSGRAPRTPRIREDDPSGRAPRTPRMREDDPSGRAPRTPRMREDDPSGRAPRTPRMREEDPSGRAPRTPRMREDDPSGRGPPRTPRMREDDPNGRPPRTPRMRERENESEKSRERIRNKSRDPHKQKTPKLVTAEELKHLHHGKPKNLKSKSDEESISASETSRDEIKIPPRMDRSINTDIEKNDTINSKVESENSMITTSPSVSKESDYGHSYNSRIPPPPRSYSKSETSRKIIDTKRSGENSPTSPKSPKSQSSKTYVNGRSRKGSFESMTSGTTLAMKSNLENAHVFGGIASVNAAVNMSNKLNSQKIPGNLNELMKELSTITELANTDDIMLMEVLVEEALTDTSSFGIIQSSAYDLMKKDLISLTRQVASLQSKLQLEAKIREAAVSFAKGNASDPSQAKKAKEQLSHANKKVDTLANELWKSIDRLRMVEYNVFCHLAGVLRWEVVRSQKFQNSDSKKDIANYEKNLKSAEYKIKELEQSSSILNHTISKLEPENNDLKKKIKELEDEISIFKKSSDDTLNGKDDINQLKLELVTNQAELASKKDKINELTESNKKLKEGMEENQLLIESKDRMITDLKSEVEELTNRFEMNSNRPSNFGQMTLSEKDELIAKLKKEVKELKENTPATPTSSQNSSPILSSRSREVEILRRQLESEKGKSQDMEDEINRLRQTIRKKEEEIRSYFDEDKELAMTTELTKLKNDLQILKKEKESLEKIYESVSSCDIGSISVENTKYSADNLAKFVSDLVTEHQKILLSTNSLEDKISEQAKEIEEKESKYQNEREQRDLDRQHYDGIISDKNKQINLLESKNESSNRRGREYDAKTDRLNEELTDLKKKLKETEKKLYNSTEDAKLLENMLKEADDDIQGRIKNEGKISKELKEMTQKYKKLEEQYHTQSKSLDEQRNQYKNISKEKSSYEHYKKELLSNNEELLSDNKVKAKKIEELNEKIENMKSLLDTQANELDNTLKQKESLSNDMNDLKTEYDLLANENDQLVETYTKLLEDYDKIRHSYDKLKWEDDEKVSSITSELNKQIEILNKKLNESEERSKKDLNMIDTLNEKISTLNEKLKEVENDMLLQAKCFDEAEEQYKTDIVKEKENSQKIMEDLTHLQGKYEIEISQFNDRLSKSDQIITGKTNELENTIKQLEKTEKTLNSKVEEINNLQQQLSTTQNEFNNSSKSNKNFISQLERDLKESQNKSKDLENIIETLKKTIKEVEEEVLKGKHDLDSEREINNTKLKSLINELKKAEGINQKANEHIQDLTNYMNKANQEAQRLAKELENSEKKNKNMIEENKKIVEENKKAMASLTEENKKVMTSLTEENKKKIESLSSDYKKQIEMLEEKIRNMDLLHDEIEELEFKLQTENQKHERAQRSHEAEISMINDEKETLKLQVKKLRTMLEETKSIEQGATKQETEELKEKIEKLTEELKIHEKNTDELQLEIDDAVTEYTRLLNLNKEYEREKKNNQKEINSLRSALNKIRTQMEDFLYNKVGGKPPANQDQSAIEREQNIRKEFRKLLLDTREQYQEMIDKEIEKNTELQQHIRKINHDREEEIFQRVNISTQTNRI